MEHFSDFAQLESQLGVAILSAIWLAVTVSFLGLLIAGRR